MKTIGITGGVGAGKSTVLGFLKEHYSCRVILADDVANELKEPNRPCYRPIVELLGQDILDADGIIDKAKMAERIFHEKMLLKEVENIIHPAVRQYILEAINKERADGKIDYLFIEAALLIQCGYGEILDCLWYIYVNDDVRRKRLKESRGYSDEKIDAILRSQLSDEAYRANCQAVIDNSNEPEETYRQINQLMGESHHV